ncbi:hypothetical protein [Rhodomicrobium lacus]|uniref:hypothetical protein n=1 Tax=Rhodomicrobium lacus TaxID=2498452 RepID=UPI000F8E923F|nr:hypothetical protein [Rhodomicrobium lacus]
MSFLKAKQYLSRFWKKYVVAEDHDEAERMRQKRIDNIMLDVIARESMLKWERERFNEVTKKQSDSKRTSLML